MNPPYMGAGSMNEVLSKYVKKNYEEGKADLFSTFMMLSIDRLVANGKYGMINMQSWMFLSSFEKLRNTLLNNFHIENMLHLGPRTFDELSGEVVQNTAFVIAKHKSDEGGVYFRLVDGKNCTDKKDMFLRALREHTSKVYYQNVFQSNFEKIPGCPVGYWVSPDILRIFTSNLALSAVCSPTQGLATADNARFLRLWFEVSRSRIGFGFENAALAARSGLKWFPHNKGGGFRRWYGNQDYVLNWKNNGEEIKNYPGAIIRNPSFYYKSAVSWSVICSNKLNFRFYPVGVIPNMCGMCCYTDDFDTQIYILGLSNSKISELLFNIMNPTLNLSNGVFGKLPYIYSKSEEINPIVQENIFISRQDWDAHETSWDFQRNELLNMDAEIPREELHPDSIEWCVEQYKKKWEQMFNQLHTNEEELNRQFIEIYGLQDELTPDVPIDEITILQQGEISFVPSEEDKDAPKVMKWNDDVIIKQLISYAVGCMMGRYRLDKPGLHIAHPEPTAEEIAPYSYHDRKYEIDDDGILPLMNSDCGFSDNAPLRMADFVRIAFGEETQVENLNYMEQCLGKTLEQYFVKDFWKDHKKMYQNRPIYWLFASKKGTFQVIAYMHRMNAYTVERIRAKYLLPFIEHLEQEIKKLDMRRAELTTKESKQLQTLQKQLDECREYHERLQVVAEQAISFDLDDGVVVNYAKFGDVLQKIK